MLDDILNLDTMGNHIIKLVVYGGLNQETANELHYRSFCYFKEQERQRYESIRQIPISPATNKQDNPRTGETD